MLAKATHCLLHFSDKRKLPKLEMFDQKLQNILEQKSNLFMKAHPQRPSFDWTTLPLEIFCFEFLGQEGAKLYFQVAYGTLRFKPIDSFEDHKKYLFSKLPEEVNYGISVVHHKSLSECFSCGVDFFEDRCHLRC